MEREDKKEAEIDVEVQKIVDSSRNIVWLSEIGKKDIPTAGGKGANLAEMYNINLPVPPAFIVTAQAFSNFFQDSNLKKKVLDIISKIDLENTKQLEEKAKEIQKLIVMESMPEILANEIIEAYSNLNVDKEMIDSASSDVLGILSAAKEPCFVAVRSSATTEDLSTASFAGQQESFLNIKGNNDLVDAVKRCWASLFTARAIYYRTKNGFSHETSYIAVVVQKMINSEKSGVIFSVNPMTNNKNEIIIEAVFGLGEGIVSGAIEPDNYVVNKEDTRPISKRTGKKKIYFTRDAGGETIKYNLPEEIQVKPVLDNFEIKTLANYAIRIEEHYKWPQDIEFAIEGGHIYIVQSRPITTLKKEVKKVDVKGDVLLEGLAASSGVASGPVRLILDLKDLDKIVVGDILVTKMTNPDMVVTMQKSSAIVTDEGGLTAHAAIVSREVGLPCVVGTRNATTKLKEGQIVTVDGTNGKIYDGNIIGAEIKQEIKEEKIEEIKEQEKEKPKLGFLASLVPESMRRSKQEGILVKVNCDLPSVAQRAAATGADGVGLVRIEFIITQGLMHPAEYIRQGQQNKYSELIANGIEKIAQAFKDKPVWVRTSDIRTDEYRNLKGSGQEPEEENPMLGWHGIRRSLDDVEILKAEFKAIKMLHDKGYKNVGVMIPFVINVSELVKAKQIAQEVGLNIKEMDFGVMIETPASCMIIDDLCREGISFISFGTNDLTQLVLGIDRNNERLAGMYDEMHPAVSKLLEMVISVCKMYNVKTSICGQAGSKPEMALFLKKKGINSISANIDAVEKIREAIK